MKIVPPKIPIMPYSVKNTLVLRVLLMPGPPIVEDIVIT